MKKLLFFAAMMLGLASCQTEPEGLGVDMGAQETNITVALPEVTRANSALSGLDNGVLADHDLRFILEIYSDGGNECLREEQIAADGVTSTSFNVRLVPGHAYEFVVWADFVKNGVDTYFDTTNGLDAIEMSNLNAMTEARDAYYGVASIAEGGSVSEVSTIVLKRPFAKVRVVADDVEEAKEALQKGLTTATATYDADVIVYDTFNARTKSVSGDANKVKNIAYPSAYDESNLYVDYLLVPQNEPSVIKFDLNVAGFVNRTFNTDIAVEANKLTTIKGNILTNGSDINVEIEDNFAAETIYLEGDVTLTEDLGIDRPMVVRAGATAVLNLNGHNIINNTKSETFGEGEGIIAYGELDITGEGTVQGSTMAVWARGNAGAVVNIYGGTFLGCEEGFAKGGRSVVYASSDNVVNIYGGKVQSLAADKTSYANKTEGVFAALNVADNHGMINVYGGSFYKQNPAVPGTEPAAWNAAHPNGFLAEDCVVETHDDWFKVIYDPYYGYTKVSTLEELEDAIAVANNNIVFLNDIEGDVTISKSVNINGDGKTYTGKMTLKADVTIKNVNIDGKGYNGYAIETRGANHVTIEDCTAKNYGYGFVQTASGTVLTTIKNVTVSNVNYGVKVDYSNAVVIENADITAGVAAVLNSNYGEKPITIKNSKLNILGTWARNNTTKTNYVFEGDNTINTFIIDAAIDNFKLAAGATLTAPNAITVTTVDGYTVEYADGKYISKL